MERNNRKKTPPREDYAKVLDVFMEHSHSFKERELVHALGLNNYSLLELVPKEGVELKPGDTVYIGKEKREHILFIKRQVSYEQMTEDAKAEIIFALTEVVKSKEPSFIEFFNKAGPITLRKHAFELIPSIGKKHLMDILEERKEGEFKNFEDIKNRLSFLQEPEKAVAERLLKEVKGEGEINFLTKWQ